MRGMRATTEIVRAVGGEMELARVLELIVKRGRALVHARSLIITLLLGDELVVSAAAGEYKPALLDARVPLTGSIGGGVLSRKRPMRLSDVSAQLRFTLHEYVEADGGLIVPLLYRGRPVGVLYAFDRQTTGPEFSRDDEQLLESFAASAATAVATAQEFTAHGVRRSIEASERERQRWARELHDQTLQDLAGLRVTLSSARRRGTSETLAEAVDDTIERLGDGIDALRAIITDLRPAALDQLGVKAALETLVERARNATDAPEIDLLVDLDFESERQATRPAPAIEDATYRLIQEALSNALKHASARRVEISVVERDGAVHIDVQDDGRGFDTDRDAAGFGLIGMRERVALVDGTLDVRSQPGGGTELHAELPVRRRNAADRPTSPERGGRRRTRWTAGCRWQGIDPVAASGGTPAKGVPSCVQPSSTASTGRCPSRTCPSPSPGPEQVLVRIEASGLCHTDIHAARGEWPVKPTPPFIPGHEGVGVIERLARATRTGSRRGCASRCPGWATRAETAGTATPAGRRSASPSRTPATRSTAASPTTPSATLATSSGCRTASTRSMPRR